MIFMGRSRGLGEGKEKKRSLNQKERRRTVRRIGVI